MSWYQLQACDELFDLDVICVDKQEDPRIKNWEKIGAESHEMPMPGQFQDVYWDILFHLPIVARNYEYG